jgi:hypothetical protein
MQAAARQPRSMRSKKRATGVVTFHLTKLKHRSTRKQVFGHNADCCNSAKIVGIHMCIAMICSN